MTTPRFTLTHTPHTSRTSCTSDTKAVILNTFNSQPTGNGRFLFIAAITINGTVHCTTTEATGPIQALCYMLDSLGIAWTSSLSGSTTTRTIRNFPTPLFWKLKTATLRAGRADTVLPEKKPTSLPSLLPPTNISS